MPRKKIAPDATASGLKLAPNREKPLKAKPAEKAAAEIPKTTALAKVPTPEDMMVQAIEKGMSVDTLERIMGMRRELVQEAAKAAFYRALAGFQSVCPTIKKTKIVRNTKGDDRGKVRYRYAPIDSIIEQTREARLAWALSHTMVTEQTATSVKALCTLHHEAGWSETTSFEVPIDAEAYMTAPQKAAAALTFAKRYALCNAYGIVTGDEDNDANPEDAETEVLAEAVDSKSAEEVLESIEAKVKDLPEATAKKLGDTARRLYSSGNVKALEALEDSVIRQVIAAKAGPIARGQA